MAFVMWFLGLLGVAPTQEDFVRMDREFRERGHHLVIDFGGQRIGGTRWTDDNFDKLAVIGLGYEYLIDRHYHGVGFEVLGQSLGTLFKNGQTDNYFYIGGGLNYYPIRGVRLFTQGGATISLDGANVEGVGRLGIGYRFQFFQLGMQPYAYVQTTTNGQFGWLIGFRFQY